MEVIYVSTILIPVFVILYRKNMSKSPAIRPAITAVNKWLERMEEENRIWDRQIADEPFDASQFLQDCISYRKRSLKYISVKKRI